MERRVRGLQDGDGRRVMVGEMSNWEELPESDLRDYQLAELRRWSHQHQERIAYLLRRIERLRITNARLRYELTGQRRPGRRR